MSIYKWSLIAILVSISTYSHAEPAACLSSIPDAVRAAAEQDSWTIVQPQDLEFDDIKIWKVNHPGECPGVSVGNFFHGHPSYLLAVVRHDGSNLTEKLILVTLKKDRATTEIVVAPQPVPAAWVVWRLPKGSYMGIDGTHVTIGQDSFVYQKLVGTANQYYYQGSHLHAFALSR